MNLPINELVSIGNVWILHLESKNILKKEWEVKVQKNETSLQITYSHKSIVSDVKIDKKDDFVSISLNSVPNYIPVDGNYIRIFDSKSIWNLSKISDEETKVTLQSYAVIDGLPSFVVELFIVDGPIFSLSNLKNKI